MSNGNLVVLLVLGLCLVLVAGVLLLLPKPESHNVAPALPAVVSPVPMPTPTPASPSTGILFSDSFANGFSNDWSRAGEWLVENGKVYVFSSQGSKAYVTRGTGWANYAVDLDITPDLETAGVIVRCQPDLRNYVCLWGNTQQLWWEVVVAGQMVVKSDPVSPGYFNGEQHVRVEVSGPSYSVTVNGLRRTSITDHHFANGMPGIWAFGNAGSSYGSYGAADFDNFLVTALP